MFDDYLNERSIYNLVFQIETVWSDDARDIKNIKKAPRYIFFSVASRALKFIEFNRFKKKDRANFLSSFFEF